MTNGGGYPHEDVKQATETATQEKQAGAGKQETQAQTTGKDRQQ